MDAEGLVKTLRSRRTEPREIVEEEIRQSSFREKDGRAKATRKGLDSSSC